MKRLTLIASAAALGLGGAALADHHNPQEQDAMSGQDQMSGQDGMSEHHETMSKDDMAFSMMFDSRLEQAFSAIDADENGNISRQEWGEWQADEGFYAERFDDFDRDDDEVVSWEEFRNAAMAMYDVSSLTD